MNVNEKASAAEKPQEFVSRSGKRILVAQTAGFCYGVQRAVDYTYAACEEAGKEQGGTADKIYTYGPIVHNDYVVNDLEKKGASVIPDFETLRRMKEEGALYGATVVIRAHGVGREVYELLSDEKDGIRLVDATCPYVKKIHKIVREHSRRGEPVVVTGSRSHPEVIGILGQAEGEAFVIEDVREAEELHFSGSPRICLVSQTTFSLQKFEDIVAIFKKKQYNVDIINTICNATKMRQTEAAKLALECDAMIVIGGRSSSNTAKLCDICQSECKKTYFVQTAEDLDDTLNSVRCVGITAGASTPKSIIEEVLKYVRDEF
ncbi:MAG: 4-hydroxy-3-methylbut-2-enyl diphosphate reductase [Eubacteriales bacterium]|nr:4-hydroxy-3-methylbut-2-enyl diphosphate reductase [Eubacteriales bacterium]